MVDSSTVSNQNYQPKGLGLFYVMMYVMEGTNSTSHRSRLCYSYRQSSLNMNLDCSFSENYSVSPNIMYLWDIISV